MGRPSFLPRLLLVLSLAFVTAPVAAPAAAFQVTATTAAVQPTAFTGPCPISYTLVGTISVDGPGTVTYRWGHSPGTGILESVTFVAGDPLTKTVTRAEKCGPTEGPCDFRELVTYSPNQLIRLVDLSGLTCQAFAVTAVTATVTPTSYTGQCPKVFSFAGTISANGPGTVTYRWANVPYVHEEQTISFSAAASKLVNYEWSVPHDLPDGERWLDLIVSSPNLIMVTPPISFTLHCTNTLERLKPERLIPKKSIGPPPVELHPTPVLPAVRKPLPPPPFRLKNGQQGVVQEGKFFLVAGDGKRNLAPDGIYEAADGKKIVVKGGAVVPGAAAPVAPDSRPRLR